MIADKYMRELTDRLGIMADKGNDPKAQHLLKKLCYAIVFLSDNELARWKISWMHDADKYLTATIISPKGVVA